MKCDKYKFIFIDICKNAGTSITTSFMTLFPNSIFKGVNYSMTAAKALEYGGFNSSILNGAETINEPIIFEGKHHSIKNYTAIANIKKCKATCSAITADTIKDYFLFSVIRNPWDRMVSLYLWGVNRDDQTAKELEIWWRGYPFDKFITEIVENQHNEYNGHRYKTQLDWVSDHNNNILVDFFVMYENLEQDFSKLLTKLNLPKIPLLKQNSAHAKSGKRREHYRYYYNDLTAEMVSQKYAEDIKFFNYQF